MRDITTKTKSTWAESIMDWVIFGSNKEEQRKYNEIQGRWNREQDTCGFDDVIDLTNE